MQERHAALPHVPTKLLRRVSRIYTHRALTHDLHNRRRNVVQKWHDKFTHQMNRIGTPPLRKFYAETRVRFLRGAKSMRPSEGVGCKTSGRAEFGPKKARIDPIGTQKSRSPERGCGEVVGAQFCFFPPSKQVDPEATTTHLLPLSSYQTP